MKLLKGHPFRTLFLVTNLLFAVLYYRFLIGDGIYLYLDVGSDSISSSYPIIALIGSLFRSGTFAQYSLYSGLGSDITATYLQYMNPLKAVLLLFSKDALPFGLIIYTLFITNLTSLFGFLYFRLLTRHDAASVAASAAFTFSSFVTLWSQNLSFGVCMTMFLLSMYLLERACHDSDRLLTYVQLTGVLALFLISNYLFFYMAGVFMAVYLAFRLFFRRTHFFVILLRLFELFLCAAGAVLLSMIALIPTLETFLSSSRSGDVKSGLAFYITDPRTLLSILSRFFSANLAGVGSSYSGNSNYYEIAALSVCSLTLFAVLYYLFRRKTALRTGFLVLLAIFSLSVPAVSQFLCFNPLSQRWAFMIVLLECITIAFFIRDLFHQLHRSALIFAAVCAPLLTALSVFLIGSTTAAYGLILYGRAAKMVLLATAVYAVILLLAAVFSSGNHPALTKVLPACLIAVLAAELIMLNYDSLYLRPYVTRQHFQEGLYHDGTEEAVRSILSEDSGLYRIGASDELDSSNAGMVSQFASTSVYSNTISSSVVNFASDWKTYQVSRNFFRSGYEQFYQFTLLCGRYLTASETLPLIKEAEPSLFASDEAASSDRIGVLKNNLALPFGYVYTKQISYDAFKSLDSTDRMRSMAQAFYYSDSDDEEGENGGSFTAFRAEDMTPFDTYDLMDCISEAHDLLYDKNGSSLTFHDMSVDPYVYLTPDLPDEDENAVSYLHLKVDPASLVSTGSTTIQVFCLSRDYPDPDPERSLSITLSRAYPEATVLLPDHVTGLRFDPGTFTLDNLVFDTMQLEISTQTQQDFAELASTDISDISFKEDTYQATVTTSAQQSMLCVPLFYSDNWTAEVDGRAVSVSSINGGLTGISLAAGTHRILLRYKVRHFTAGLLISAVSVFLYLSFWTGLLWRRKKSGKAGRKRSG